MPDYVRLYDRVVLNSGWARWQKKLWRKARDTALGRWQYPYKVKEFSDFDAYREEGITLGIQEPDPNSANNYGGFGLAPIEPAYTAAYAEWVWNSGRGFVMLHPDEVRRMFLGRVTGRLTGVICHELGHALGFGHGGTGIMESAVNPPYYPNDEELKALHSYCGR